MSLKTGQNEWYRLDVLNEFMEDVPDAALTVQHQSLLELLYTVKTGADGTAMLYDIPEGKYRYNITAPRHIPYSGSFEIKPGITTIVPIALEMKLIEITWSVVPTVIQDKYEIVINQTFETHVPTSVIVTEPASINLPKMQPGQVFNGEFTITNYGLVAADYKGVRFPSSMGELDVEVLVTVPPKLNAMQKITVPYRITRRMQTAMQDAVVTRQDNHESNIMHLASLYNEVQGCGGGVVDSNCSGVIIVTSDFEQTVCPGTENERRVGKSSQYTIFYNYCGDVWRDDGTGGDSGGGGTGSGNNNKTYDQYLQEQLSGGGIPGGYTPLTDFNCGAGCGGGGNSGGIGIGGGTGGGTGGTGGEPGRDSTPPVLTEFTIPSTAASLTVAITTLIYTVYVYGVRLVYCITGDSML